MPRRVHLHRNGGAACGAVSVNDTWPHTVGGVVWPSVVREYKCKACDRVFRDRVDNLGTNATNNRREPKPSGVCGPPTLSTEETK